MKAGMIIVLAMFAIGMCAVGVATAGTVNSVMDFTATGTVVTNTATVDEACGKINALGSDTFGVTAVKYSQVQTGNDTVRTIVPTAGFLVASDSIMATRYQNPTQNCNGATCEVVPGFYNTVSAQSTVLLYGPGSIATSTGINKFDLAATGVGTLSQTIGVIDMSQTVGADGKLSPCLNDMQYSQKTMVMGKFDFVSKFTYKP